MTAPAPSPPDVIVPTVVSEDRDVTAVLTRVPDVGRVTLVVLESVIVKPKFPENVIVFVELLATPVPPYAAPRAVVSVSEFAFTAPATPTPPATISAPVVFVVEAVEVVIETLPVVVSAALPRRVRIPFVSVFPAIVCPPDSPRDPTT
jgi:hypothetical protein